MFWSPKTVFFVFVSHENLHTFLRAGCVFSFFFEAFFFFQPLKMQDKSDFLQREVHSSVDLRIRSFSHQMRKFWMFQNAQIRHPKWCSWLAFFFGTPEAAELMFLWRTSFFFGLSKFFNDSMEELLDFLTGWMSHLQ